jgi:lysophospholipase L1-like esterase
VPAPAPAAAWVATWTAADQAPRPPALARPRNHSTAGFDDQTIREFAFVSAGGDRLRVRLSDADSPRPLTVGRVDLALAGRGAAVRPGTVRTLTFDGTRAVRIAPGRTVDSDPITLAVPPLSRVAVSLFLPRATGPVTYHAIARESDVVSGRGDVAGSLSGAPFHARTGSSYIADEIDVDRPIPGAGTVVAFGDSITDGYGTRVGAEARWPDDLARRLNAAGSPLAVVDEGLSGNRLLTGSRCFGASALARLDADGLAVPGIRDLIVLEGINDIGFAATAGPGCGSPHRHVPAARIIAGLRRIAARAHAAGIRVIGATLTPFAGAPDWTPAGERERDQVNRWIRTSGAFDGVVDAARAVADPGHPLRLRPAFDSGDHLHPDDAGARAIARAVPLALLDESPLPVRSGQPAAPAPSSSAAAAARAARTAAGSCSRRTDWLAPSHSRCSWRASAAGSWAPASAASREKVSRTQARYSAVASSAPGPWVSAVALANAQPR